MPRDFLIYLNDICEACDLIIEFTQNYDYKEFINDKKTFHAVIRNLEIIGEAVKKLPDNIRSMQDNIEWRKIAGLRDILIHEYFSIDSDIVWDIITNKIIDLKNASNSIKEELIKKNN
jgi:uncharacterized protein with HEPN domain